MEKQRDDETTRENNIKNKEKWQCIVKCCLFRGSGWGREEPLGVMHVLCVEVKSSASQDISPLLRCAACKTAWRCIDTLVFPCPQPEFLHSVKILHKSHIQTDHTGPRLWSRLGGLSLNSSAPTQNKTATKDMHLRISEYKWVRRVTKNNCRWDLILLSYNNSGEKDFGAIWIYLLTLKISTITSSSWANINFKQLIFKMPGRNYDCFVAISNSLVPKNIQTEERI